MASSEDKVRVSGETPRASHEPVLPTVNPSAEGPKSPAMSIPPAFYVV